MRNMSLEDRCTELELARVLLVDDDPTSRLTLQTVLQAGGYHVDAAASAAEARSRVGAPVAGSAPCPAAREDSANTHHESHMPHGAASVLSPGVLRGARAMIGRAL